jgi:hypothetical protein
MLFDQEQYNTSPHEAQRGLLMRLVGFAHGGVAFKGDAEGRLWRAIENAQSAQLAFNSLHGEGYLDLALAENGWVRADLYLGGAFKLRAWIEEPYEEKEFWPDGADGLGEAPGRISKRGAWLQIDCARFLSGAISGAHFWSVEVA